MSPLVHPRTFVFGYEKGTTAVASRLVRLAAAGRLPLALEQINVGVVHAADGMMNCHNIALALLVDLTNARERDWKLRMGRWRGPTEHSWLEHRRTAVDASSISDEGAPQIIVMDRDLYRKKFGAQPTRTYSAEDVACGRYATKEQGDG